MTIDILLELRARVYQDIEVLSDLEPAVTAWIACRQKPQKRAVCPHSGPDDGLRLQPPPLLG
jgi:hypothetical protein